MEKFVAYYRVSTDKQGKSGLGLDAQRKAVMDFLNGGKWELAQEFVEVESGKRKDRPELEKAIALSRKLKARLVIAKLDRLARNAAFLLTLRDSGVDFVAADMPHADKLTIGIMAIFAEHERDMISKRTKEALAQAKIRGIKLGCPNPECGAKEGGKQTRLNAIKFAENILPVICEIQTRTPGATLRYIADELNRRGFKSARGGRFHPPSVASIIKR